MPDTFPCPGTPEQTGRLHIARYNLLASLACCVRLVSPDFVFMAAENADQGFWIRSPYLFASGTTFFHVFILTDREVREYEINHKYSIIFLPYNLCPDSFFCEYLK